MAGKINSNQLLDLASDAAEVVNQALKSEALGAVPVVGKILKSLSSFGTLQDMWLARKLAIFLQTFEGLSEREKHLLLQKAALNPDAMSDLGDRVVQAVALSTDFDKPALHGLLFIAFTENHLTAEQLGRFLSAIAASHTPDLFKFTAAHNPLSAQSVPTQTPWFLSPEIGEPLTSCGMTAPNSIHQPDKFIVTNAGILFHTAVNAANSILARYHKS